MIKHYGKKFVAVGSEISFHISLGGLAYALLTGREWMTILGCGHMCRNVGGELVCCKCEHGNLCLVCKLRYQYDMVK